MEQVMELIDQLAVKLGVAAEYLMGVLVKQQYAEGITSLILAGISILITIAMMIVVPRLTKKVDEQYEKLKVDRIKNGAGYNNSHTVPSGGEDFVGAMRFIVPIASVILGIILLSCATRGISTGVQQIINPEYFAFKEILDAITAG